MAMKQCSRCGSGATDTATQCAVCGTAFEGAAAAPAAPPPPAPPAATPNYLQPTAGAAPPPAPPSAPSPLSAPPAAPLTAPAPAAPVKSEPVPGIPGLQGPPQGLGGGGGEVRLSLTGEVMEVAAPTQRGSGPGGYGPPAGARPGGARPGGPPMARGAARPGPMREEVPVKGGAAGIVFLVLLILAGAGFGGWYWYNNRTNPKDQALAAYKALLKDQDWKALYSVVALSDEERKKYPDATSFEKGQQEMIDKNPMAKAGLNFLKSGISDITVGEPTYTDTGADVPTSSKLSVLGQSATTKGVAHMIKEGGIWKLDGRSVSVNDTKVISDLIGKPDGAAGGFGGVGGGTGMPGMGGGMGRMGR